MRITRFEFTQLHDFRPTQEMMSFEEIVEEVAAEAVVEPVIPSFSEAELEKAKEAARQEGFQQGMEETLRGIEMQTLEAERQHALQLQMIAGRLHAMQERYEQLLAEQARDLHQFIMAVAKKIAGTALEQSPDLAVIELVDQCLPIIMQKPRLHVEAHPALIQKLESSLSARLAQTGFEGEIVFRGNDKKPLGDALLEWQGGRAERNSLAMWQEIDSMLAQVSFFPESAVASATHSTFTDPTTPQPQ